MAPSSSSGGAASPPPPPSGNGYQRHPLQEGSGTLDEHVRDGRTFNTALWTTTFQDNQDQISYVFRDLTRRYIRGTFEEVREAARDGLEVLNDQGNLMRPEDWMVPVTVRAPPENPFHEQVDKVDNAIDAVELDVNKHLDEEIYFDTVTQTYKRRLIKTAKSPESKKGGNASDKDKRSPSGSAAGGSVPV